MDNKFYIIFLALFTFAFAGCGGSDDKPKGNAGFQGEDLKQLAEGLVDSTESKCKPELPSMDEFNDYIRVQTQMEPLDSTYIALRDTRGSGGSTTVEIPIQNQNVEMLKIFADLAVNGKNLSGLLDNMSGGNPLSDRFKEYADSNQDPGMVYVPNKEALDEIKLYCRDLECASESLFGKSWGARFYFKENFGLSISGLVNPKTTLYKNDDHVKSVLLAVASFPVGSFPIAQNIYSPDYQVFSENIVIAPHEDGSAPMGPGAAAVMVHSRSGYGLVTNADIDMFDSWKSQGPNSRSFTVFHELMHLMDATKERGVVLSGTDKWLSFSRWKLVNRASNKWTSNNKGMCSQYGSSLPAEDFAECGVLYRFAPETLKKISPRKYAFLRDRVFNGVEYVETRDCERSSLRFFN